MIKPVHSITKFIRQFKEAFKLAKSTNFRFLRSFSPGHFYSPIPDYEVINEQNSSIFKKDVKTVPGIELREKQQLELVGTFNSFYNDIPWPAEGSNSQLRYHFDNLYFSYGDAVTLYSMMRYLKPKKVIEVGSGYSSALMLDVDQLFFDGEIDLTFIEPYPERLYSLLDDEDLNYTTMLNQPVQEVDLSTFKNLQSGDILFIDSSHVSKTGSDLNHLVHRILPELSSGVIIHFHDIIWPFEYPKKWLKAGRAWNEGYLVRAFLQYNSSFEILFFNSYLEQKHRNLIREKLPLMLRQPSQKMTMGNSSLWIRKK